MNSIVPHLNGWTKVVVWPQDFPASFFGMDSDCSHLPVQFDYHRVQPWWQSHSIKSYCWPCSSAPLCGGFWTAPVLLHCSSLRSSLGMWLVCGFLDLVSVYSQDWARGHVQDERVVVPWTFCKSKHCKVDYLYLWQLIPTTYWQLPGVVCVRLLWPPDLCVNSSMSVFWSFSFL